MNIKLISLRGRHFKVYDPDRQIVLEHPSDTEEVDVCFNAVIKDGDPYLKIGVTGFIETKMRIPGQYQRADLYILAEHRTKIAESLGKPINNNLFDEVKQSDLNISFGQPFARNGRQSVPRVQCLYRYSFHSLEAPFSEGLLIYRGGKGALDIERPGIDQTKWETEGGSMQLHFSFFHPTSLDIKEPSQDLTFYAYLPWSYANKIRKTLIF